jgi:tetratricopeptide (TPR) repeat protein
MRSRSAKGLLACWVALLLAPEPPSPARKLWQQGQDAMLQGEADRALSLYGESLRLDPNLAQNWLSMAAAYLEKGDDRLAAACLDRYLTAQPDHYVVRTHYAELLCRLKQPERAKQQLERFIADIQDRDDLAARHLASAHGRLMDLAVEEHDLYAEHLHRGIGLYCLACRRDLPTGPDAPSSREALLCRAAAELAEARQERPDLARPCWYLHCVWSALAQRQPSVRWLLAAEGNVQAGDLTVSERRRLEAAHFAWQTERRRR